MDGAGVPLEALCQIDLFHRPPRPLRDAWAVWPLLLWGWRCGFAPIAPRCLRFILELGRRLHCLLGWRVSRKPEFAVSVCMLVLVLLLPVLLLWCMRWCIWVRPSLKRRRRAELPEIHYFHRQHCSRWRCDCSMHAVLFAGMLAH